MKTKEARCDHKVQTKNQRTASCGAFLFEQNEDRLIIRCRKCSTKYAVTFESNGDFKIRRIVSNASLRFKKEKVI